MNGSRGYYKQGGALADAQRIMSSDSLSYLSQPLDVSIPRTRSDLSYPLYIGQQQWNVALDVLPYVNSPSAISLGDTRASLLQDYDAFTFSEDAHTVISLDSMLRSPQFCHMQTALGLDHYAEEYKEFELAYPVDASCSTYVSSSSAHSSPEPGAVHASPSPRAETMKNIARMDAGDISEYAPSTANATDHEYELSPSPQPRVRSLSRLGAQTHAHPSKQSRVKFHCSECGRGYARRDRRDTCEDRHHQIKSYVCGGKCGVPDCPVSYSSLDCYRRHLWPSTKRQICCHICHKVTSRQNLARHRKRCF